MGSCQFQPGTREKITTILEGKRFWENPDDLPTKNWGTFQARDIWGAPYTCEVHWSQMWIGYCKKKRTFPGTLPDDVEITREKVILLENPSNRGKKCHCPECGSEARKRV